MPRRGCPPPQGEAVAARRRPGRWERPPSPRPSRRPHGPALQAGRGGPNSVQTAPAAGLMPDLPALSNLELPSNSSHRSTPPPPSDPPRPSTALPAPISLPPRGHSPISPLKGRSSPRGTSLPRTCATVTHQSSLRLRLCSSGPRA